MGENSKIAWTDNSFNPWVGCEKVSPGCDNCYAESWAKRGGTPELWQGKRRRTKTWGGPVKWNRQAEAEGKRVKVFCASLADVFDNKAPQEWRDDLWALIKATPNLDWIIVTKRIGNAPKMLPADWGAGYPNVWLLITVVNQEEADRDIPKLLATPAAIRGLSVEPQLEAIDLIPYMGRRAYKCKCARPWHRTEINRLFLIGNDAQCCECGTYATIYPTIDWVITAAESGPKHRPYNEDWARYLRDDCGITNTAFFYKQRIVNGQKDITPELDGKRWMEFPR